MEIVRAELTDAETLAELNQHLIEDERHPNSMNIGELTERMKEWLATDYICYYVDRAHRRKGIATQLLDWLYENVWTDKKVRLDVLAHNKDAVAFYKRYGFRIGVFRMEK